MNKPKDHMVWKGGRGLVPFLVHRHEQYAGMVMRQKVKAYEAMQAQEVARLREGRGLVSH